MISYAGPWKHQKLQQIGKKSSLAFGGLSTLGIQIEILIHLQRERELLRLRNFCGVFLDETSIPDFLVTQDWQPKSHILRNA